MYSSTLSLTSALYGGGGQRPAPAALPPGKDPVPIVQEAGWAPGPVWTCAENFAPTGIRSPDRPVRSESLYYRAYDTCEITLHVAQTVNMEHSYTLGTYCGGRQHRGCIMPQTVTHSLVLLKMGKIISRNMLS